MGKFVWIFIVLITLGLIAQAILSVLRSFEGVSIIAWLISFIEPWLPLMYFIAFVLSVLSVGLIVFTRGEIERIVKEEREKLYPQGGEGASVFSMKEELLNPRWERIEGHIASENPGEWRIAILEADIMLEEMLEAMGYLGEGVGERLKQIEKSDFRTLDQAWEAHKIRNQIAHEGVDFHLTEREARRVIGLYKQVFDEFQYI